MTTQVTTHPALDRACEPYGVPFHVERHQAPTYLLRNTGHEQLTAVTLTLLGHGVLRPTGPRCLEPGTTLRFVVRADDTARSTIVVVRWFRPDGREFLWRISF